MKKILIRSLFALVATASVSVAHAGCETSFTINLQTFGEGVNVELRAGSPGKSRVVKSSFSRGGQVAFYSLCPGSYFLAIGNDENVNVTPVRQFEDYVEYTSNITIQRGSGNVSKRSRGSL